MSKWKRSMEYFFNTINAPAFGAGFIRDGAKISAHPKIVSFDGVSAYFFNLKEKEACVLLEGVTLLNGYKGWLAYMLQEIFFDETYGDDLYDEILEGLYRGIIAEPSELSREALYRWVEGVAPAVEELKKRLEGRFTLSGDAGQH